MTPIAIAVGNRTTVTLSLNSASKKESKMDQLHLLLQTKNQTEPISSRHVEDFSVSE